jgi:hypothetical protein
VSKKQSRRNEKKRNREVEIMAEDERAEKKKTE